MIFRTPGAILLAALVGAGCAGASQNHSENEAVAHAPSDPAQNGVPQPDLLAAAQQARQSFTSGGAPSLDALMDEFVQALSKKDFAALDKLRVSKSEYIDLIVPGTVAVDKPPRAVSQQPKEYYWSTLDTKSHYYTENLLGDFGGRAYRSHDLTFTRATKQYAWYTARGQVRLELYGEDGVTYHLVTGWVAEVDGRYKFIGYNSES